VRAEQEQAILRFLTQKRGLRLRNQGTGAATATASHPINTDRTEFSMKKIMTLAAALLVCAGISPAQFEGVVRMVAVNYADDDSSVIRSTVYFKGKLLAAVIGGDGPGEEQGGKFILRGDRNVMWIVIDEERKGIDIPISDSARRGADRTPAGTGDLNKSYTLSRTGKTSTLRGYRCEEWVADEGEGRTARIWATKELGDMYEGVVKWFDQMSMESATENERWERELAGAELFPLRVVRSEEGVMTESEEVVSIEKKKVAASMFEAPAGYRHQSVDLNFEKMFEDLMKKMGADSTGNPDDSDDDGDGL